MHTRNTTATAAPDKHRREENENTHAPVRARPPMVAPRTRLARTPENLRHIGTLTGGNKRAEGDAYETRCRPSL